jgi:S-adenosylmethionine/arginine decarboxylase-like enzyme
MHYLVYIRYLCGYHTSYTQAINYLVSTFSFDGDADDVTTDQRRTDQKKKSGQTRIKWGVKRGLDL